MRGAMQHSSAPSWPRDAHVILQTELGGARILEELEDDPLPRIC